MKARYLFAIVALGVALGLAMESFAAEEAEAEAPTVVELQFRDYRIAVAPGENGSLYSVRDKEGRVIADRVTAQELRAKLPDVHRFVKDAFAGDRKIYLDARNYTN